MIFLQISIVYDTMSLQNVRMHNIPNFVLMSAMDFIQISIIYDNICKVVHKKCHLKSCHSDIKYHMTLNTLFNATNTVTTHGESRYMFTTSIIGESQNVEHMQWCPVMDEVTRNLCPNKYSIVVKVHVFCGEAKGV